MDAKRNDYQPIKEVFLIIVVNDDDEEGANLAPFFMLKCKGTVQVHKSLTADWQVNAVGLCFILRKQDCQCLNKARCCQCSAAPDESLTARCMTAVRLVKKLCQA
jgi:hypothetical protein